MKDQARIQLRTRRVAKVSHADSEKTHVSKKLKEVDLPVAAFKPYESKKPEIPGIKKERRSTRITAKELTQTTLPFQQKQEEIKPKRKSTISQKESKKKQKKNHDEMNTNIEIENSHSEKNEIGNNKVKTDASETQSTAKTEEEAKEVIKEIEEAVKQTEEAVKETQEQIEVAKEMTSADEVKIPKPEKEVTSVINTTTLEYQDTPSPPSSLFPEPLTPPVHTVSESSSAPYKTYVTEADKERIEYEKTTLKRLRKALDIIIPDRFARNVPCFYHQIEQSLRNSTQRNISLSHICQVMYIAPKLYSLEPTEIRNFGGKAMEAYKVGFGSGEIPVSAKDFIARAVLLETALNQYFIDHPEFDATIPQVPLPRLKMIIDKKEWIQEAQLPPGVRAIIQAHEDNKKAEQKKDEPKPKPTGSVKDRMAALRARLAQKKK